MKFIIRNLEPLDYYKEYFNLLQQLTDAPMVSFEIFNQFVNSLSPNHQIFVIEDISINKIVSTGTILIENKLIHGLGQVAHIEDIVTDLKYRGQRLGKDIIEKLIDVAYCKKCYKIILDCSEHNIGFYLKCGFDQKAVQMVKYLI